MSKINILSKDVYNKIAAGEVVEKPASVVKELVENCIDAGATNIVIEVLQGGIQQIKVSDNGCGIDFDDFDKVFLAHATSKVKTVDDLSSIGTLGFRGEALSSIAAVSKVTLSSKTEDSHEGYQVIVTGGEMGEITPIGSTTGTNIVVSDLFFNIPARKKFLRKPKLEETDITNYIARLILANPNVSIKYIADNKIIYQSFGTGLYDAIYSIYGKTIVDNISEVKFEKGYYKFSGFIGKPTYSKPNRTYQTLIINGRYVINQTISTAIYKAYENFLMKGNFPFFVLHLEIPLDKVDVNVHPNKLEVKFEDSNNLFAIVYSGILDILYNINTPKSLNLSNSYENESTIDKNKLTTLGNIGSEYKQSKEESEDTEITEVDLSDSIEYETNKNENELSELKENVMNAEKNGFNLKPFVSKNTFEFKISQPKSNLNSILNDQFENSNNEEQNTIIETSCGEQIQNDFEDIKSNITQDTLLNDKIFKNLGSLFNTYILVEFENKLILIDQHAAHERILFDKFNNELNNKQIALQQLIIPFILETNYSESIFIVENIDTITNLGFEIEKFGENSFKINTVPLLFENINLQEFFDNILHDIDNKLLIGKNDSIKEYISKKACKSAVKANDPLTNNEINILLDLIKNELEILQCPHGRPILVEVTKKEIEKWFKRII